MVITAPTTAALKITGIRQARMQFFMLCAFLPKCAAIRPAASVAREPKITSKIFPVRIFAMAQPRARPTALDGMKKGQDAHGLGDSALNGSVANRRKNHGENCIGSSDDCRSGKSSDFRVSVIHFWGKPPFFIFRRVWKPAEFAFLLLLGSVILSVVQ